jgi:hypothetical protein
MRCDAMRCDAMRCCQVESPIYCSSLVYWGVDLGYQQTAERNGAVVVATQRVGLFFGSFLRFFVTFDSHFRIWT